MQGNLQVRFGRRAIREKGQVTLVPRPAPYLALATDVWRLSALRWVAQTSMLKTLAAKHSSPVTKMAARYRAKIDTPHGPRRATRPGSNATARNRWSPGSAGYPSNGEKKAVLTTASPPRCPPAARS